MNNIRILLAKDNDGKSIWKFLLSELKPKGKFLTPFNIISIPDYSYWDLLLLSFVSGKELEQLQI